LRRDVGPFGAGLQMHLKLAEIDHRTGFVDDHLLELADRRAVLLGLPRADLASRGFDRMLKRILCKEVQTRAHDSECKHQEGERHHPNSMAVVPCLSRLNRTKLELATPDRSSRLCDMG